MTVSQSELPYSAWVEALCAISRQAGELIMRHYQEDPKVMQKEDDSPVTEADLAANHLIVQQLAALTPEIPTEIPTVSEEGDKPQVDGAEYFWLVDPLDGTKSFIRKEGEFTVNIGLIKNGAPVLGVIYVPAQKSCYWGVVGEGAWRQREGEPAEQISTCTPSEDGLRVVASLSHFSGDTAEFLERIKISDRVQAASSLKFCRLAEGAADLYPRFGTTMEWDTAAGHAILSAAGGRVETPDGQPFSYGKAGFINGNFVAWGR